MHVKKVRTAFNKNRTCTYMKNTFLLDLVKIFI